MKIKYKIIRDFYEGYFVAWEQKKQIYCWKGEWAVFTEEDLSTIVSKVQKKVMNIYSEWSQTRTNSMHFNKYMAMILGGETNERKKKNKMIYLNLWNSLKRDFHKETEYQIIF